MIGEYIRVSSKNLTKRKLRSWLTMIGIFIGIAAVVSLIGLGEGLRVAITSQFGFLGTDILSVQAAGNQLAGAPGTGSVNPLSDDLVDGIRKLSGIKAAFNRRIESGTLEFNDKIDIGFAGSCPEGETRTLFERMANLKAEQGRLLKDGDTRRIVLGNDFSKDDIFGKPIKTGDRVLLDGLKYEVIGILKKKGSFIFDSVVLINEAQMKKDFGDKGTTNIIAIQVKNQNKIGDVKAEVEKYLRKERDVKKGEEDFTVESPQQTLETLNSTLFAVQLFVYIIASISLLVGGIGIMNTMYTSVLERTKEIGIMKSIGAKNSTIFSLFFIESGFLGMVGGIIGVFIGLALAYGGAAAGRAALGADLIQAHVSPWLIIGALSFSFIIGTLAGVLPALQASKLQPVDSLRYAK